eukprot:121261_1
MSIQLECNWMKNHHSGLYQNEMKRQVVNVILPSHHTTFIDSYIYHKATTSYHYEVINNDKLMKYFLQFFYFYVVLVYLSVEIQLIYGLINNVYNDLASFPDYNVFLKDHSQNIYQPLLLYYTIHMQYHQFAVALKHIHN